MTLKKQILKTMGIKEWCDLTGMTLTALSEIIPCSQPYLGMLDNGKAHPSFKMAKRIQECTNGMCHKRRWYPEDDEVIE